MSNTLLESKLIIEDFYTQHPGGVVVIRGATATGKTSLSLALSDFFDMEVISADSRQVYQDMDVGTDKIVGQMSHKNGEGDDQYIPYISQEKCVPHWLIDIVEPDGHYTAGEWKEDTVSCIDDVLSRGKKPFVVGGTGLYIDTIYKNFLMPDSRRDPIFREKMELLEMEQPGVLWTMLNDVDPDEASRLHPHSTRYIIRALEIYEQTGQPKSFFSQRRKPDWPLLMLGLWREKDDTNRRINKRIKEMLAEGRLVGEVQGLLDRGFDPGLQSMQGIGYKEVVDYLTDHHDLDRLEEELKRHTHRLAKKQRSWFRRYMMDAQANVFPEYIVHSVLRLS